MAVPDPLTDPAMLQLVTRMQAAFVERGQTLTDAGTADAYRTTLGTVALILDGALATGALTAPQHTTLRGMIDAAQQVPDHL